MLVRPITTFDSSIPGFERGVVLSPSDIMHDTNPHVRARPELFEEVVATTRHESDPDFEQATANPGERRRGRTPK